MKLGEIVVRVWILQYDQVLSKSNEKQKGFKCKTFNQCSVH